MQVKELQSPREIPALSSCYAKISIGPISCISQRLSVGLPACEAGDMSLRAGSGCPVSPGHTPSFMAVTQPSPSPGLSSPARALAWHTPTSWLHQLGCPSLKAEGSGQGLELPAQGRAGWGGAAPDNRRVIIAAKNSREATRAWLRPRGQAQPPLRPIWQVGITVIPMSPSPRNRDGEPRSHGQQVGRCSHSDSSSRA